LHVESRAVWGRYDRDGATHKYKLAIYEFRWIGLILGGTSVVIIGVYTMPGAEALAWLGIVLVLFWLVLFVLSRPGPEPRPPPMSRPLDLSNSATTRLHAGDKFAQNESTDLTSTSADRPRVSTMTWWCMGCEAGLRLPSGREGIVICPKCGTRNWART
jgi:DNA-directed RNA polymerase subunit RPC12/RpoP